jgi:hypothetical protein
MAKSQFSTIGLGQNLLFIISDWGGEKTKIGWPEIVFIRDLKLDWMVHLK